MVKNNETCYLFDTSCELKDNTRCDECELYKQFCKDEKKRLKNTLKFVDEASLDELTEELEKYGIEFEDNPCQNCVCYYCEKIRCQKFRCEECKTPKSECVNPIVKEESEG